MANFVSHMSHHDPAINALAFCGRCKAVFLGHEAADNHQETCEVK